ncbi:alanine racemase [Vibrio sp. S4M6]|uniref:alanine racemase n=1 Tax=Vibrio sinus TaxID=2946865 RepID=UPI00202A0117|nr:alanine racemase [Vibrio sinus]MCL9783364.1 alanine racemase [Vibrio sinus]
MAEVLLNFENLKNNYNYLNYLFGKRKASWGVVTKLLSGNDLYLRKILELNPNQILDSRIDSLMKVKSIDKTVETIYIRPPSLYEVDDIVEFSDISFNTEVSVVEKLNHFAKKKNKTHKVVLMSEMGDIREGIPIECLLKDFYKILKLSHISIVGIGANFYCLSGVLPTRDKFSELVSIKRDLESRLQHSISWVSAGSSKSIGLIESDTLPDGINHYRIGYSLFFGGLSEVDPLINGMSDKIFSISAEIIEIKCKSNRPYGSIGDHINYGGSLLFKEDTIPSVNAIRAIVNIGNSDAPYEHLEPVDKNVVIVGASSEMLVVTISGGNRYKVGDKIFFYSKYVSTRNAINSKYIKKVVV